MAKTIGNPVTWTLRNLGASGEHLSQAASELGGTADQAEPVANKIEMQDLRDALRAGYRDFLETRADVLFIAVIYPLTGLILFGFSLNMDLIPLLAPLVAGFALLGPVAAVGRYEISRRLERGEEVTWLDSFRVVRAPSFGAILVLGFYLTLLFLIWLMVAHGIWERTLGPDAPVSVTAFARDVVTTSQGWTMAISGIIVGFFFALLALAISVVSFPLLLDREVGVPVAVVTSFRVFRRNPVVILTWGAVVAGLLILGSIPLLLGLIFVMPILGHATWHLYRRAVS
ncbi:DUF2189 domain-containing protein [Ruegeria marina]|uniref:Uncharacterized membrane protein n=1 Tax=Ruegeria marina TaxID=639004 RepID=A0A1G6ZY47_9RHOB|nr:DUF2189 domain-containing protein [Ruegeria marina]SDE07167.1 Uncharacterized membrane protein [Ruegeria marina]